MNFLFSINFFFLLNVLGICFLKPNQTIEMFLVVKNLENFSPKLLFCWKTFYSLFEVGRRGCQKRMLTKKIQPALLNSSLVSYILPVVTAWNSIWILLCCELFNQPLPHFTSKLNTLLWWIKWVLYTAYKGPNCQSVPDFVHVTDDDTKPCMHSFCACKMLTRWLSAQ